MANENKKPTDFLEKFADKDFEGTVGLDVADVTQKTNPDGLLFTQNEPPPESDDTFTWTETPEIVARFGSGMFYAELKTKTGKTFRYYGKTRTDVTRQLMKAQTHASEKIEEITNKPPATAPATTQHNNPVPLNLVPDTKLPYDPISVQPSRQLTQQEIIEIQEMWSVDPIGAQRKLFVAMAGCTPETLSNALIRLDTMFQRRIADEAAFQFQANHLEDWDPTPGNSALFEAYLRERRWPITLNNMEIAFQDLSRQNRLTKPVPEVPDPPPPAVPDPASQVEEIFEPPPPPVSVPSGSASSPARERAAGPSREEVANYQTMPLDQMRSAITDALRRKQAVAR